MTKGYDDGWLSDYFDRHPHLRPAPSTIAKDKPASQPEGDKTREDLAGLPVACKPKQKRRQKTRLEKLLRAADPELQFTVPDIKDNGYGSEAAFQQASKEWLVSDGWTVKVNLAGASKNVSVWTEKGWPDLDVYAEDGSRMMFYLELKQPGKKPTDHQLKCHARLRRAGFIVRVVYTLDQVKETAQDERNRYAKSLKMSDDEQPEATPLSL